MKIIKKITFLAVAVSIPIFFSACDREGPRERALEKQRQALEAEKKAIDERIDILEEQKEIVKEQREVLEGQKELYRKQTELKLDEFDTRIDELRAKAAATNAGQAEEAAANKRIDELVRKKEAVENRLDRIDPVDLENWENYKLDTDAAIDNLRQSYNQLRSQLGE